MDAISEVMRPDATPTARQVQANGRDDADGARKQNDGRAPRAGDGAVRLSEDPMRRTDRYRLVMPYSSRV
jgi:hypothetical protein